MRAVLSLGSNMDDRVSLLKIVYDEFADDIVAASPVFSTPPWGMEDQGFFHNSIIIVEVEDTPLKLLRRGQALEHAAERVRNVRWGPRTLDVDVIQIWDEDGEYVSDNPTLITPHPYAHERAFVLVPWLAVDPEATLGGTKVADLVKNLDPAELEQVKELGTIEELLEQS